MSFEDEIRDAIHRSSRENDSNTPDFILAQYMCVCLDTFSAAVRMREKWYDRVNEPGIICTECDAPSRRVKMRRWKWKHCPDCGRTLQPGRRKRRQKLPPLDLL